MKTSTSQEATEKYLWRSVSMRTTNLLTHAIQTLTMGRK